MLGPFHRRFSTTHYQLLLDSGLFPLRELLCHAGYSGAVICHAPLYYPAHPAHHTPLTELQQHGYFPSAVDGAG